MALVLALMLATLELTPLASARAWAQEGRVAAGTAFAPLASWEGSGTKDRPYLVKNADDLRAVATWVNGGDGAGYLMYFEQTGDIALDPDQNWTPIGDESHVFAGVYDGHDHAITGMNIDNRSDYAGLFGHIIGAEIRNLTVQGSISVTAGSGKTGYRSVGGIVGRSGSSGSSSSASRNCVISGCVSNVDITSGRTGNGGVCGYASTGTNIRNCVYLGTMRLSETGNFYGNGASGGILGYSEADNTIVGCVNRGAIANAGSGDTDIGGILGKAHASGTVTIDHCYNRGDLSTAGTYMSVGVGGIIGSRTNWWDKNNTAYGPYGVTIHHCYNAGAVAAPNKAGDGGNSRNAGGIIGYTLRADSYGDAVITDANTHHVYSMEHKAPCIIASDTGADLAGHLNSATTFQDDAADAQKGIPWVLGQLGEGFKADANYVNDGLPLLGWQSEGDAIEGDAGRVVFSIEYDTTANLTADSAVSITVDDEAINGRSCILTAGTHTYTVDARGYETKTDSFTVANDLTTAQTVRVTLTARRYEWKLTVTPAGAGVTLADESGEPVTLGTPDGGVYTLNLVNGVYTARATADGYYGGDASFEVAFAGGAADLSLNLIPETAPKEPTKQDGCYLVYTPQELSWIDYQAARMGTDAAVGMARADIKLMADIDMGDYDWYPMFGREQARNVGGGIYSGGCYQGTFDGDGHVIKNLRMERENVHRGFTIERTDGVGLLFGYTNGATVKNVGVSGSIELEDAPDGSSGDFCQVGGLVGMAQRMTRISNCYADVSINVRVPTGYKEASDTYIGGIAGSLTTGSIVTDCYSRGAYAGHGSARVVVGGIAGSTRGDYHKYDDTTGELIFTQRDHIERCYSSANLEADPLYSGYVGGIVGGVREASTGSVPEIWSCFALNGSLRGSGASVEANRIVGSSDRFEDGGYYNYALDSVQIVDATQKQAEDSYRSAYGSDVSCDDALLSTVFENLGWSDAWNLTVVDDYPRLKWESVAGHDHEYDERVVAPTCTNYGYTVYTCTICGEQTVGSFTNPGVHRYGPWEVSVAHAGSHEHACTECDAVEAEAHEWDGGTVTRAATASASGVRTYRCIECEAVRTEPIPRLSASVAGAQDEAGAGSDAAAGSAPAPRADPVADAAGGSAGSSSATAGGQGQGTQAGQPSATRKAAARQTLKAVSAPQSVKCKTLKKRAVKVSGALSVKGAKTKLSYAITKVGKAKFKKSFTVNDKGVITVKRGTPKGSYKLWVKARAAASGKWRAASITAKVTITVK